MRLSCRLLLLPLLASGSAHAEPPGPILPGSPRNGDWVRFYARESGGMRQDYSYDRTRLRRTREHVLARWKVVNTGSDQNSITMYVVDIDCRRATFTEAGTAIIEAGGRRLEVPRSELLVDGPARPGTSADLFRRMFCR
jgi:hypothetical protein